MKKILCFLVFILAFFPLVNCFIYEAGVAADFNALLTFFAALVVNCRFNNKTWFVALCGFVSILSTTLAVQINTQLYVQKVSDDWASLYIGNIFMISTFIITTVSVLIAVMVRFVKSK